MSARPENRTRRRRFARACGALWLGLAASACADVPHEPALVPRPAQLHLAPGVFEMPATLAVRADGEIAAAIASQLVERSGRHCGRRLQMSTAREGAPALHVVQDPGFEAGSNEAYRLMIDARVIELRARGASGLRHAATTALQLLCAAGATSLPALRIDDAPAFAWRGVMLDSARHFQSVAYIKRFLDAMALHKLNVLHWHLTDDQGWRLQIRKYPRLTDVGAWRVPAGAAARADIDPGTGAPRRYGGFYSQREVAEIVAHATALGIEIVPEIEMPGHASAAIAAYPWLGARAGAVDAVPADWGIYPNAFALDERTFGFIEDVLRETIALFPSRFIHVGGDEVEAGQWLGSDAGRALAEKLGTRDGHALQAQFTERVARFLAAHDRRLVGWDEILSPGLAAGAVVMSWRGVDGAVQAAGRGHDAVMSVWPTLYFDNRQSAAPDQPPGRMRVVSLRDVYAFEPLPSALPKAAARHVLGLQGAIWTEHVRTEARVDHMAFPRAAAIAELGWTPASRRGWDDFARRLPMLYPHYAALGVRAARIDVDAKATTPRVASAWVRSDALTLCSEHIPLWLEDDAPRDGERAVFAVDVQQPCWLLRGADLDRAVAIEARVAQVPFNFQIGAVRDTIRLPAPTTDAGELEVRVGDCDGGLIARLPLAPALASHAVTTLPRADLATRAGRHDLCLRFAQHGLDPLWVIDAVRLVDR